MFKIFLGLFLVIALSFGQWVKINPPALGTQILASYGSTIFAANISGVFVSSDHGQNWHSVNVGLPKDPVLPITVYHVGNIVVANDSAYVSIGGSNGGVFVFSPTSDSWRSIRSGRTTSVLGVFGLTVMVAVDNTVLMTTNKGQSWQDITTTDLSGEPSSLAFNGSRVFIGTSTGLFYSDTTSWCWVNSDRGLIAPDSTIEYNVSGLIFKDTKLFAISSNSEYSDIFVSSDTGKNWNLSSGNLPNTPKHKFLIKDSLLFVSTQSGIFSTINDGANWSIVGDGLGSDTNIQSMTAEGEYLFASDYSLYRIALFNPVDPKIIPTRAVTQYQKPTNVFYNALGQKIRNQKCTTHAYSKQKKILLTFFRK